jgi:serine/threonine-protein kinase
VSGLLTATSIVEDPADYVARHGVVLATFDHRTQDSGNVSWVVDADGRRLFVKTAGRDAPPPPGAPDPYFDHAGRVALLRNAVELARSVSHPALPPLLNVLESPAGPVLVYAAAEGELVHVPRARRADPDSAYQRLASLPSEPLLGLFDRLIDLHVALAAAGWVAVDLYDGCLIVDFATGRLTVVDLDSYRRGPSTNDMGRMFGSTRFMAPEEFERGAPIDQRTTVYTLGRLVWHFGTRLTERRDHFCGPPALATVVRAACHFDRATRPATVAAFADAWRRERAGMGP